MGSIIPTMIKEGEARQEQTPVSNEDFFEIAKRDTFKDILTEIEPLLEKDRIEKAQEIVRKELLLLAQASGGPTHKQLIKIRKEFEAYLPEEANQALNPESPEAYARRGKNRAAEMGKAISARQEEKGSQQRSEGIKEKTWDVPAFEELKPGLILEIQRESGRKIYEVLSEPKENAKSDWIVRARLIEGNFDLDLYLDDAGIQPYRGDKKYGDAWHPYNRPIRWYQKESKPNS